jgi:hypothetical protein
LYIGLWILISPGYPGKDGYPPAGYPPAGYPPPAQGYPQQGYPQQGYPPQYAQPPPQQQQSSGPSFMEGWYVLHPPRSLHSCAASSKFPRRIRSKVGGANRPDPSGAGGRRAGARLGRCGVGGALTRRVNHPWKRAPPPTWVAWPCRGDVSVATRKVS